MNIPLLIIVFGYDVVLSYIDYLSLLRVPVCVGFSNIPGFPVII